MTDNKSAAAAARSGRIEALLEERRGYELRGLPDRVAAVDAALADAGYSAPAERKAPAVTTAKKAARKASS